LRVCGIIVLAIFHWILVRRSVDVKPLQATDTTASEQKDTRFFGRLERIAELGRFGYVAAVLRTVLAIALTEQFLEMRAGVDIYANERPRRVSRTTHTAGQAFSPRGSKSPREC
jgi:hypothetical protein